MPVDWQVLDCLADGMAFGALEACGECKGQLVFKGDAYYCTGDISAWTKCVYKTTTPKRKDWVTPKVGVGGGLLFNAVCGCPPLGSGSIFPTSVVCVVFFFLFF